MYQLKTLLTTLLFSLIVNALCAQAELCDNCYIWEFTTDNGERDQTTRLLSNDIEDILSQYSSCKVLQRSRYAKLQEQINNEKAIQSLSGANAQIKTELKTIQAKRVIFGSVNRDFQGNVALRLSFENLQTSQVKSNTVFLTGDDYYNFEKRKLKLTAFINSFVNPDGKLPTPDEENKQKETYIQKNRFEDDTYVFILKECKRQGSNIQFTLSITAKEEDKIIETKGRNSSYSSRFFDNLGNEYKPSSTKIANKTSEYGVTHQLIANTPVNMVIIFPEVQSDASKVTLFEIGYDDKKKAQFRDIQIK